MTPIEDTFEDRLLDALLDRFDTIADQSLIAMAPAAGRVSLRRCAVPVGCLAAAAAATSLTLVEMGGGTPVKHFTSSTPSYALAAWRAQPTTANAVQISAAEANCSPSSEQPAGDKQSPTPAGGPWSLAIIDTRGDLTLALYSDGNATMACLTGPTFVWLIPVAGSEESAVTGDMASLDKMTIREVSGDICTIALGRTGSEVTGVGLQRVDGSEVTASVANGRFLAWWPQGEGVTALSVTTKSGTQQYPVNKSFSLSSPQPNNKVIKSTPDQPKSG